MTQSTKTLAAVALLAIAGGAAWYARSAPRPDERRGATAPTSAGASPSAAAGTAATPPSAPGAVAGKEAPGEDFAPLFARKLAEFATRNGLVAAAERNVVTFDMDGVLLDTKLEHDNTPDGKRGIGIAVGATIRDGNGVFRFTSGAIGVGRTRDEAIDQAVSGWLGLSGTALLEAVPRRAVSKTALPYGPFTAYPGAIAVRGPIDLRWDARREAAFLEALAPSLRGLDPGTSHQVAVTVIILGGGALDGQCLVDDRAADELCKLAQKYDWPASAEGYMVRQVYLLRPRLR